ncbi:MAG: class I SAM-dependent methyltransferase [Methanomicrobiales archaeon]|nr:class I SAM-dependent methyltransferase [Methanomicrobiales archaeon]
MLDNPFRRLLQDPEKILAGHIRPGMTTIDLGCGPGDFTRAMATMAGERGTVIAIDLQKEMLLHAQHKCRNNRSAAPITWHQCGTDTLGISAAADFVLSFYMVHEVPDQGRLFREVNALLKPNGKYLVVEPVFHVTDAAFAATLAAAKQAGFLVAAQPALSLCRAVLLEKAA